MSGGVNVKSGPRVAPPTGIPLPRSPAGRAADSSHAATPTHSPSLCRRSCSTPCRNLLVSHSAYSSPLSHRRAAQPPPPHDGNHNTNAFSNQNQAWGAPPLCPPHGSREVTAGLGGAEPPGNRPAHSATAINGNLRPSATCYELTSRGRFSSMSQSDEEMGTSEDSSSSASSPGPLSSPLPPLPPPIAFTLPTVLKTRDERDTETDTPRVNMAAVAPFSYRLQVQDREWSADELSDCSSGSIEVCCDDLTPVFVTPPRGDVQ